MTRRLLLPSVRQKGVTLTELMIALVLGALVVLAATAMVVTSRGTYRTQDETTRLQESARFGLELTNRLGRLAGYTDFGDDPTTPANYVVDGTWTNNSYAFNGPNVVGADNSKPTSGAAINGSDSLTIRYFGSSNPGATATSNTADGNILDCAGTPVPQPVTTAGGGAGVDAATTNRIARAYNVLFVDLDTDGEPALKCQRQTYDPTTGAASGVASDTQTLIRGVEAFQVLYGELIPQPSPNSDLDLNAPASIVYRTGIGGSNPVSNWQNVRSVRIAMLLRTAVGTLTTPEATSTTYQLFGPNYPSTSATFALTSVSAADRTRARRIVQTTVFIRNRMAGWDSLQAP
jgi:type IV pilus assembly protein PilW